MVEVGQALTLLAVLGCGLMAGLFLAFSTAVMPGLRALRPAEGAAAMQRMNAAIMNPLFGLLFAGTPLVCLVLVVVAVVGDVPAGPWLVGGSVLYLVGGSGLTLVINVPMNTELAAADPTVPAGERAWSRYQRRWTRWNHVRALACFAATLALGVGLVV